MYGWRGIVMNVKVSSSATTKGQSFRICLAPWWKNTMTYDLEPLWADMIELAMRDERPRRQTQKRQSTLVLTQMSNYPSQTPEGCHVYSKLRHRIFFLFF